MLAALMELLSVSVFFVNPWINDWECTWNVKSAVRKLVGPCPHRDRDYHIQSNFWKFYLIRTSFTLGELVSFMKVFRLFRLERIFFGVRTVDTVGRCTTSCLLAGPECLWCLVMLWNRPWKNHHNLREQQLTLPGSPHSGWNWTCSIVKRKKTCFTFQVLESCQIGRYIDYRHIDL